MTVKFKFDYVLDLHNRQSYITAIERDGIDEETAYKRSLVQINKGDIKSITKSKGGYANVILKKNVPTLATIEDYDEIIDVIQNANLAVDIMHQEKVYIFDGWEVDTDELNVCNNWSAMKDIEREVQDKLN